MDSGRYLQHTITTTNNTSTCKVNQHDIGHVSANKPILPAIDTGVQSTSNAAVSRNGDKTEPINKSNIIETETPAIT